MSKHYHFIGIGGIGVGALAALSLDHGYDVSGSDLRSNQVTERLKARGAEIFIGHASENIRAANCVVFSSAIKEDNPELVEARKRGILIVHRAKLLSQLMEGYIGITIAGAHGKTTTTSMIAHLLVKAGLQPTTAIGGIVNGTQAHAQLRKGEYFVTEADESDGSFLNFTPHYSVITNIDLEHIDYYHDWPGVLNAYREFIGRTAKGGSLLVFGEDQNLLKLTKECGHPVKTFGFSHHNNIRAENISFEGFKSRFDTFVDGKKHGTIVLRVLGRHNVANALACIGLGLSLSIDWDVIRESLEEYEGVQRRFQLKGKVDDIWVIDDYAHHPTEIQATLEAAQLFKRSLRGASGTGGTSKLIAIFQPHRYSRVQGLLEEFVKSLVNSDHLIVTDIYAASEKPIEGVTSEKLCERIRLISKNPVHYFPKEKIIDHVLSIIGPQDMVMTLGAGDITRLSDDLVAALKRRPSVVGKTQP